MSLNISSRSSSLLFETACAIIFEEGKGKATFIMMKTYSEPFLIYI